jgi:hypothetical protein
MLNLPGGDHGRLIVNRHDDLCGNQRDDGRGPSESVMRPSATARLAAVFLPARERAGKTRKMKSTLLTTAATRGAAAIAALRLVGGGGITTLRLVGATVATHLARATIG